MWNNDKHTAFGFDLDLIPGLMLINYSEIHLPSYLTCEVGLMALTFRVVTDMRNIKPLAQQWNVGETLTMINNPIMLV